MLEWPKEPGSFPAVTTPSLSTFLFSWVTFPPQIVSNRISCQSRTNSCCFRMVCCAKTIAGLSLKGAVGWFLYLKNICEGCGTAPGLGLGTALGTGMGGGNGWVGNSGKGG